MASYEIKNYGYCADEILDDHFVLGGLLTTLPKEVLQPTGDWSAHLPDSEIQRNEFFDTYNCTGYGTLNALEFLFKRKFGKEMNWSERYVGIAAETYPPGNSPHKVIETIRKSCGLLNDQILPLQGTKTVEEYYSPNPLPLLMVWNGQKFLEQYEILHEWVFQKGTLKEKQEKLMEALRYSPLGVSVHAWIEEDGFYIKPEGVDDTHWTVLYSYEKDRYWLIFDSYDSTIKKLAWNYDFGAAKRYWIGEKVKKSFWQIIFNYFKELVK